ncbi:type VI secretion system ATPase TssH [Luteibacter sp.]|jgi:type VI secretion system protein VasG|uniref:type VI secretion system ATPase TssH n=1 Tax=Luteibacter sp. TaxID=1886636 RepID=UPI002F423105
MTPRDPTHLLRRLNKHCAVTLESAASFCHARMHQEITPEHWLLKMLDAPTSDLWRLLHQGGVDVDALWQSLDRHLDTLPRHGRGAPRLSRHLADALLDAWLLATGADATSIGSLDVWQALSATPSRLACPEAQRALGASLDAAASLATNDGEFAAPPHVAMQEEHPAGTSAGVTPRTGRALDRFTLDLTAKAERGDIDTVLGRDDEIERMIDVLGRRRKNNPILVGDPGVGKTAIVEGLALRIVEGAVPQPLRNVRVLCLDLGLLQAGAGIKGEFEQRLRDVIEEVQRSAAPILLFVDEAHTLIGAGNTAGGSDAANLLKPALARGSLRTIAATTWSEYKQYFERDAALERRFQRIVVDEPDDATACLMLRGVVPRYAAHHEVDIRDEAITAAVRLSRRYIPARQLPDKAVDLIDTAAARVRQGLEAPPAELRRAEARIGAYLLAHKAAARDACAPEIDDIRDPELEALRGQVKALEVRAREQRELVDAYRSARAAWAADPGPATAHAVRDTAATLAMAQGELPLVAAEVDAKMIATIVADWTGVPAGDLMQDEIHGLLSLEDRLRERIVAQDEGLSALAHGLRMARAGLRSGQGPLGVYLLAGPSGVGKTGTALALADLLFGGEQALTTINMSEYQESHTVSQLKGAPPGYVGFGQGGILTEAVRKRPYGVLLLDEIEKAHPDVLDMFYQVFDRGMLRDGEGREADFRHCVILMTSNLGSEELLRGAEAGEDVSYETLLQSIRPSLVRHFKPALLARLQPIVFRPLDTAALARVARMKIDALAARLNERHRVSLRYDGALPLRLANACLSSDAGAREVESLIDRSLLAPLSEHMLLRMATGPLPEAVDLLLAEDGAMVMEFTESPLT